MREKLIDIIMSLDDARLSTIYSFVMALLGLRYSKRRDYSCRSFFAQKIERNHITVTPLLQNLLFLD